MSEPTIPTSDAAEIADRYQIIAKLGAGAFGTVFKARDKILGRMVAIKTIRLDGLAADGAGRDELMDRFGREARIAAQLKHPNIVTIYDVGEAAGLSYLAMEFIDGIGLDRLIASVGSLPVERAAAIATQVADALDYAHKHQVVHRDIKPANVMIEAEDHVKVTDFGIAKPLDAGDKLTVTGSLLGTPSYMSPEQARGGAIDGRSDLFALGCILYEMLSGTRAFTGESITGLIFKIITEEPPPLRTLAPTIPEAMARIVDRALSKAPTKRYQSGQEMAKELIALTGSRAMPTMRQAAIPTVALSPEISRAQPERAPNGPIASTRAASPAPPIARSSTSSTARQAPRTPARKAVGLTLALIGAGGLALLTGVGGVAWYLLRHKSPDRSMDEETMAETAPFATPSADTIVEQPPTAIPESPPQMESSPDLASAQRSSTQVSIPAHVEVQATPPPVVDPRTSTLESATPSAVPSAGDYTLLDPIPDEGTDGTEAGRRLAGMYRRESGTGYGTSRPMRIRRRVPIGKPAERPALRMLHHIVNAEEAYKGETGRYGTLAELAQTGRLSPAVLKMLRKWGRSYYRYEIKIEGDGFTLSAQPLLRRGARSFIADDSGIIRPVR